LEKASKLPQMNLLSLLLNWVLEVTTTDVGKLTASHPGPIPNEAKKKNNNKKEVNMAPSEGQDHDKSFEVFPERLRT
jgi:hypothetical protein